ncbi:hypothetical protein [Methanobacterium sp.]|uniref:hypothetical protein n=1 Tax=Methanobacterium sp. TaxID=2164 RepID=UPI003C74C115
MVKDFCTKNQTDIATFNDENMLFNFLKDKKLCSGSSMHYIILFNVNPPLGNVMKVIDTIKEDNNLKCLPMFLLTTSIDDQDIINSYTSHLNCYIIKPKDMGGLINVLDTFKDFWLNIATLP